MEWSDTPIVHLEALLSIIPLSYPAPSSGHLQWTCWSPLPDRYFVDKTE